MNGETLPGCRKQNGGKHKSPLMLGAAYCSSVAMLLHLLPVLFLCHNYLYFGHTIEPLFASGTYQALCAFIKTTSSRKPSGTVADSYMEENESFRTATL